MVKDYNKDNRRERYTDILEIHVLELPKLKKRAYPQSELLKWAKFINAETKEEMEHMAVEDPYIRKAYEELERISQDKDRRQEYEERLKALRDYQFLMGANLQLGYEKGVEAGKAVGIKEGLEEGREKGLEEGIGEGLRNGIQILLSGRGDLPDSLKRQIQEEKDTKTLELWLRLAGSADSVQEFEEKLRR